MPQQTLGRHHHQRQAEIAFDLTAEQVKILRRRGGVADLDVVVGGQFEVTLQVGAGVFGALPFDAVRQQQHQPAEPVPFASAGGDIIVDDDLSAVGKIAELGLPYDQRRRVDQGIAVFETDNGKLRQRTVIDLKVGLIGREIFQRSIRQRVGAFNIPPGQVPLRKSAAGGILAAEPDAMLFQQQRPERQRFGEGPGQCGLVFKERPLFLQKAMQRRMQTESVRRSHQMLGNRSQHGPKRRSPGSGE